MGKGKGFNDFTYGVGLEISAQSFKQVKDDLKLNLDNLSKMVKSYGKILKIDPEADFSTLFSEARQLKSIIDGINGSNNPFSGFVDKGTLGSIAALEERLSSLDIKSDKLQTQFGELKSVLASLVDPLKSAGEIKFPATFENLFGNFEDQSKKIKSVSDSIATLRSGLSELKKASASASDIYSGINVKPSNIDTKGIEGLIKKFYDVRNQLSDVANMDSTHIKDSIVQIKDIGIQLANAISGLSDHQLATLKIDDTIVVDEFDDLIHEIETRKNKLSNELVDLKNLQEKFKAQNKAGISSRSAGVGLQSDITAQVKVTPKANDAEWAKVINDTIKNIEPNLHKVHLRPTFSKSNKIDKEVEGSLAHINHKVGVELKVDSNIEKFKSDIKDLDAIIKEQKGIIEKNGSIKIKFEPAEGDNVKGSIHKMVNQLSQVKIHVDAKTSANFIKELGSLRTKANKELKNISSTIKAPNTGAVTKSIDKLRSDIDSKIGNIDINLHIKNEPQIISQATLIRDKLVDIYGNTSVAMGVGATGSNAGGGEVEQLSEAALVAKQNLEKCRQALTSLQNSGFDAPEFLQLGDITPDGKKIKDSEKKLNELLNKRKELQAKLPADLSSRWQELYPEANGNMNQAIIMANEVKKELDNVEAELNAYLQKQIAYTQSRYEYNQKILQQEKEIATAKKSGAVAEEKIASEQNKQNQINSGDSGAAKSNEQLAMSAEEASKKVRSLTRTLSTQKKTLKDLESNGINSEAFMKVGQWDKEANGFKKFSQETLQLIAKYKELKNAREAAGGKRAVGEEAQLRGKLAAILREQKKHAGEILDLNQKELESARAIVAANKESSTSGKVATDIKTLEGNVDKLTEKLNKARSALSLLKSDGISSVGSTGLRDSKGVLKGAGITQSLKEVVALYNELLAKKKEFEAGGILKSAKNINAEMESLNKARQLLTSKGFLGLTDTKIGDVKGRLGGDPEALNTLVSQYKQLLVAKKEFEKSGDTTSENYINTSKALEGASQQLKILHQDQLKEIDSRIQGLQTEVDKKSEYVKVTQECNMLEGLLADVHKNQVEYAQSRVNLYSEQLSKAQELLQVEQQRAQVEAQHTATGDEQKQQTTVNTDKAAGVVKLDSSTLSSIAKEGTLKSIDGKVGNILSQLGSGLNITGSNISINASNVSVSGNTMQSGAPQSGTKASADSGISSTTDKQRELNSELAATRENVDGLSKSLRVINGRTGQIAKEVKTYRTSDRVSKLTKTYGWVKHGKGEPATYENVSNAYETNMDAYNKLYNNFINALSKQKQIEKQIFAADGPTSKLQAELEIQKEITASLEAQLSVHEKLYTQEARQAAITEANKKAQHELAKISGAKKDSVVNKQNTELMKIVDSAQKKSNDMQYAMSNFKVPMADSAIAKVKEYNQLLTTLKIKQQEINANPSLLNNENYSNKFTSLLQQMKSVEAEFTTLQKSSENFLSKIRSAEDIKPLGSTFDPNNLEQMHDEMTAFANQVSLGKAKLIEFNDAEQTATFEIKNGRGQIQQLTVAYDSATNSLGRYTSKTRESVSETQKFIGSLKQSFQNVARYVASFGSVYRIFAIIRQGVTYVRDIDSALTELKKVTNETDEAYRQFLQDMSKTGSVIGATVKDLTNSASDWARLGYSMKEAGELAKNTSILMNVSEFEDVNQATDTLISSLQAFKKEGQDVGTFSMEIIDKYNEVGNNYAISTSDLAESLTRSSAALVAANNSLEESIAMTAAANTTIQDPESVGKNLPTLKTAITVKSLRRPRPCKDFTI